MADGMYFMLKAIESLYKELDNSNLSNYEKKSIEILITKIKKYYIKKIDSFSKYDVSKRAQFDCYMTDIIVEINDVIRGVVDFSSLTDLFVSKRTDNEINKLIKKMK